MAEKITSLEQLLPVRLKGRRFKAKLVLRTCRYCLYHFAVPEFLGRQQYCDRKCMGAAFRARANLYKVLDKRDAFETKYPGQNPIDVERRWQGRLSHEQKVANKRKRTTDRIAALYDRFGVKKTW